MPKRPRPHPVRLGTAEDESLAYHDKFRALALEAAQAATVQARAGNCPGAYRKLKDAEYLLGRAHAAAEGFGRVTKSVALVKGRSLDVSRRLTAHASDNFYQRCVVKP